jgi:hypothetical protein
MKLLGGSNLKVQKYTNVQKSQKGFTQTLYKAHLIMGQSETSTHPMHHVCRMDGMWTENIFSYIPRWCEVELGCFIASIGYKLQM